MDSVKHIHPYQDRFKEFPVLVIQSPGRINLIGEHIDYYGGYVLPASIDRYITLEFGMATDGITKVYSKEYDEEIILDIDPISTIPLDHWKKYILQALNILSESSFHAKPFQMALQSNIPVGAGLSSSAALLCGFITGLSQLNDWSISKEKIALLAQSTEHRLGTPCGLMDQYASLFGKQDSFLLIDFNGMKVKPIQVNLKDFGLLLINTNVHHQLTDGGYARRRREGESALETLKSFYGKRGNYRDFSLDELTGMPLFDETEFRRARHAISENKRVLQFVDAIESGDVATAGKLMYQSHASLRDDYQVSCEEADIIVAHAQEHSVTGARMMGGGFGGCVLCLIKKDIENQFIETLIPLYRSRFGFSPEVIQVNLGEQSVTRMPH